MPHLVSLHAVVDEMETLGEGTHVFLNRLTGELFSATDDMIDDAESEDEDDEDLPGWEVETVQRLREILGSDQWLELPRQSSHEDHHIMERFCRESCEGDVQEELLSAIQGRGAFRRFKDLVHRRGVQDAWYAFRQERLAEEAKAWLDTNEIAFEE
jgi:hypothetical protein